MAQPRGRHPATCAEAFRPYNPVLANLTGVSYWWGWVPTCGLTAILSASALHEWYLPWAPVPALAVAIVLAFCVVNLVSVRAASRIALPIACLSALLALASAVVPSWRETSTGTRPPRSTSASRSTAPSAR